MEQRENIGITLIEDIQCKEVSVADILFLTPEKNWLDIISLPGQPLDSCILPKEIFSNPQIMSWKVPVIYGKRLPNGSYIDKSEKGLKLGIDIFGSAFFMLTRYEEIVKKNRDIHGRFSAYESIAFSEGFLDRPLVNELVEVLWNALANIWPCIKRKKREFTITLSHDIDSPFLIKNRPLTQIIRNTLGDITKRKALALAAYRIKSFIDINLGNIENDLGNTFDYIMNQSEKYNLRSSFYFKTGRSAYRFDNNYSIDDPSIRKLIRNINKRGHEIGLHPSYNTYLNYNEINKEFQNLLRVCDRENIQQCIWGGRHHYLQWEVPTTWQYWDLAGINYDSTLSFYDQVGFRCGTCYEYPVYNLLTRKKLNLRERPLIIMEGTLLGYMGLSNEKALGVALGLKRTCKFFDGNFTLLWHNDSLLTEKQKKLYQQIIAL